MALLTDQEIKQLIQKVQTQGDTRLLVDAIKLLITNRVELTQRLRAATDELDEQKRFIEAHPSSNERTGGGVLFTLSRLFFGNDDPDPTTRLIQAQNQKLAQRVEHLSQRLSQIDTHKTQHTKLTARLKENKRVLLAYQEQITELTNSLESAVQIDEVKRRIQQETRAIRGLLSESRDTQQEAEQAKKATQIELSVAQTALRKAKEKITELEQKNSWLTTQVEDVRQRLETTQQNLAGAMDERDTAIAQREQALATLDANQHEKDTATIRAEEIAGQYAVLQQHNSGLTTVIERHVREKQQIRNDLLQALNELQQLREYRRAPVVATIYADNDSKTPITDDAPRLTSPAAAP